MAEDDLSRTRSPRLRRLARGLGFSARLLWPFNRRQSPARNARLRVLGESLLSFMQALLRLRYPALLDRKLATVSLRLRLLMDGMKGHALFTVDEAGKVTSWNRGAERVFGYTESEILGQHFSRFFTPEDNQTGAPAELLAQANREERTNDRRWQVRKDGTCFFAEGSLTVLGKGRHREFGRQTHDVTDQRKAEEALRQTQKLESIGVLASGIAHDFNNLLSGIMSGVTFALANLESDHPAYASLAIVEQASEKAADLTRQLMAYAGQGKFIVTRFDLSALIRDILKLLQTSIPKSVDLQMALQPDLAWIEGDASQIQQIVMNLVINGAESMERQEGTLWISTGTEPEERRLPTHTGVEVYLEVRDSGSGMTEATKARIFDPFFTTKSTGRGLGLAAIAGIVRTHKGRMQVESSPGKGSTFRICFPGVEERVQRTEEPAVVPAAPSAKPCTGTILVVDDEPGLRKLAQAILEQSGYQVLVAEDGRQAVEVFREHADTITAILLDMTMPVMGGDEAFRLIRSIRTDVPILVSTGYGEVATQELFGAGAVAGFVQKPYTAAQLVERIGMTSQLTHADERLRTALES